MAASDAGADEITSYKLHFLDGVEKIMLKINVTPFTQQDWESKANSFADHNLYQTWAYQYQRTGRNEDSLSQAEIVDQTGQCRLLAMTRIIKVPILGYKIGYVQWGPLLRFRDRAAELNPDVIKLFRDHYLSNHVHVLRISPNLYTDEVGGDFRDRLYASGFEPVSHVKPYHTLIFPLDISEDQMRKRFHSKWRATLRKAEKKGLCVDESNDTHLLKQLDTIYRKSQSKKGFKGLPIEDFIETQEILLASQKLNMIVVKKGDDLLTVDVNSYLGDTALGLFQSTTSQGLSLGASYVAWWNTLLVAKRVGMKRYDTGGVDPKNNASVYRFKLRMGADEKFHIGCYDAYADKWVKRIFGLMDNVYYKIKRT